MPRSGFPRLFLYSSGGATAQGDSQAKCQLLQRASLIFRTPLLAVKRRRFSRFTKRHTVGVDCGLTNASSYKRFGAHGATPDIAEPNSRILYWSYATFLWRTLQINN